MSLKAFAAAAIGSHIRGQSHVHESIFMNLLNGRFSGGVWHARPARVRHCARKQIGRKWVKNDKHGNPGAVAVAKYD